MPDINKIIIAQLKTEQDLFQQINNTLANKKVGRQPLKLFQDESGKMQGVMQREGQKNPHQ